MTSRLADPALGGSALSSWRDRVELRRETARPPAARRARRGSRRARGLRALRDGGSDSEARGDLVVGACDASDRIAALLDMLFGLGALTERAYRPPVSRRRHRIVRLGVRRAGPRARGRRPRARSWRPRARASNPRSTRGAPGSRPRRRPRSPPRRDPAASWSAVSASAFVAHGWARLARVARRVRTRRPPTTTADAPAGGSLRLAPGRARLRPRRSPPIRWCRFLERCVSAGVSAKAD